jgi:hypothetical protein
MKETSFFKKLSSREGVPIALLLITGLSFTIKYVIYNRYSLPPGNDPPMYIIIGKTFLEGRPVVAGYPPLIPLLFFFGGITLTKIYGPLISSLLGLSIYLLVKDITHQKLIATVGCAIGATGSIIYAFEASLAWGNNAMLTSLVLGMILYWLFIKFNNGNSGLRSLLLGLVASFLLGFVHILAFVFYFVICASLVLKLKRGVRFALKGFLVFVLPGISSIPFILSSAKETVSNPLVAATNNVVSVSWFYFYYPFYSFIDLIFDSTVILLAIIGIWVVHRFYRDSFSLLVLAVVSPVFLALLLQFLGFTTFYSRFLEFSLPPLLTLSSISLGHFSILLLRKSRKKIVAGFLVFLFISLTWGMMMQRLSIRVENDALSVRQFECEAFQWLNANTAGNSTIAATYPLATWIEVLSGRKVVSGYHELAAISTEGLLEKYRDVEIIQLANYYREIGFLRVYDMSPISWTLSPMVSVFSYDKGEFMPVFWIDNGLSYFNDSLLAESFKTYRLNNDTYVVQGDNIEKQLSMTPTNLSISYNFTQSSELDLTVFFYPEIASSLDDISVLGQQTVTCHHVSLVIKFNNASAILPYKDATWNLVGLKVSYKSATLASISVHTNVLGQIPNYNYTALRQQLLAKYKIDYIVVYKNAPEGGWAISMLREADKIAFENQDVAIFKVNSP